MSVVLYALGAGLIGWGGYMLLASDSFAAIDIAASLAGWGVFAIGLGAVTGALRRLARAVESTARPWRERADPRSLLPAKRPQDAEPAPAVAAPAAPLRRAPAFEPRLEARRPRDSAPRDEPRSLPSPDLWLDRRPHAAEAAEPIVQEPVVQEPAQPEPAAFDPPAREPVAPEPKPVIAEPAAPEPPATPSPIANFDAEPQEDDPEATLSKKERRHRRREAKLREESQTFERPEVIVPQLGGGRRIFEGPDRDRVRDAFRMPGPVAPPLERAALPFERVRPQAPVPAASEQPALRIFEQSAPEPAVEAPIPAAPFVLTVPDDAPAATVPTPEPPAPSTDAVEPKVPEWLARARARREARVEDAPAAVVDEPSPEPEPEQQVEPEIAAEPVAAEPPAARLPVEEPASVAPEEQAPEHPQSASEEAAGPKVVREGEHRGVTYRFFEDGSVEALSAHGKRRFGSVEELRATVIAARGPGYEDPEPKPAAAADSEPAAEPEQIRMSDEDPFEAALSELEGGDRPSAKGA